MRIYSSTYLTWPGILHLTQAARLYPGRWHNYYLYRIKSHEPIKIITYSPVSLLQQNRYYYCYDRFARDTHSEKVGNSWEMASINEHHIPSPEEVWIHIPKCAEPNDIIAIHTEQISGHPNISYTTLFVNPALQ